MIFTELAPIDFLISLLYLIIISLIAYSVSNRFEDIQKGKIFFYFILFKIFGGILFTILHVYVYQGGDTFVYFQCSKFYLDQFIAQPEKIIHFLTSDYNSIQDIFYNESVIGSYYLSSADVRFMGKIGSLFLLLGFKQFMATNILVSVFSAMGIWQIYRVMTLITPSRSKLLAIGILFYPTTLVWGSGLLKDSFSIMAIGLMFIGVHFISRKKNYTLSLFYLLTSIYTCLILKPYILYTFAPVLLLWTQDSITSNISNSIIRIFVKPIIIIFFAAGGYLFIDSISENAGKYSLENVQSVAEGFHAWHTYLAETRGQSGYSLGDVEFTPLGVLVKSPEAFFVTFYRPLFFIDVRNFATAFEAIQSTILLILTLYLIFKIGLIRAIRISLSNHHIRAFIIFSVTFGVTVGLTSYNFGALSRYKIPALPFYTTALIYIYHFGMLSIQSKKQDINT